MESQRIEWKEVWHDEHLKGICGFANAQGGELHIGKNDNGEIVGIKNANELLEKLPLKIRNSMGVVANIDLTDNGKCIVIKVNSYPNPISYHGKYYIRS
ncbi:hypothetical protein FACS189465_0140 [Clostridia bacterium]|nr:hypothetical protein FACS189465_0140 [Clostridia bacterium]